MCAFLLPVCFFFIRYSQEGADKRRQQWMIHEQPDGEGVVGTRSSAAAKIQNARNPEIPEMPEWLERKKGQKSQIQNQRRVWYQPWPGAGCASSSRHTSLSGQGKKVPENIIFFFLLGVCPLWSFIKMSASHRPLSMRRLSTHPSPPMSNLEKWLLGSLTQFIL